MNPRLIVFLSTAWVVGCGSSNVAVNSSVGSVSLTSIAPAQAVAGASAVTIRGYGSGFTPQSILRSSGVALASQRISSEEIDAVIPKDELTSVGTFQISVSDPDAPTTGSPQTFNVTAPNGALVSSLISAAPDSSPGNNNSGPVAVSQTGRYVAFASYANNLAAGSSRFADVYLRDTCYAATATCGPNTMLISVGLAGSVPNGSSGEDYAQVSSVGVSSDGRYVAFESSASNLVVGDSNNAPDVFIRDTCNGATSCNPKTSLISISSQGQQANAASSNPSMTPDGRYVVFESAATNLVSGMSYSAQNIYMRDTCNGAITLCSPTTTLVSQSTSGVPADIIAQLATVSADGRYVAFEARANTLLPGLSSTLFQIYLRDTCVGAGSCTPSISLVSASPLGTPANGGSTQSSLSSSGRYVAFASGASNLVNQGSGNSVDIYVRDTCSGVSGCTASTTRISSGTGMVFSLPRLGGSGAVLAFNGAYANGIGIAQAYTAATCLGLSNCSSKLVEVSTGLVGAAADSNVGFVAISGDAHRVAFQSGASNLLSGVVNGKTQIYLSYSSF